MLSSLSELRRVPLSSVRIYFENSLLLPSNRATWDHGEIVSKDAKSIFQRRFHGRTCTHVTSPLSDHKVPSFTSKSSKDVKTLCTKA